ncbi:hypothetical protein BD410DRAFT_841886 [Rickenella mellea]|uniref:Uncharacterized protein n=1 Tax=Rickenella mellea TaxID=50990 RepID=A0A4Y7PXD2_9AGAM|nr:hypothetical protein BD410DRAFT_841886 [Rickenella mellea]
MPEEALMRNLRRIPPFPPPPPLQGFPMPMLVGVAPAQGSACVPPVGWDRGMQMLSILSRTKPSHSKLGLRTPSTMSRRKFRISILHSPRLAFTPPSLTDSNLDTPEYAVRLATGTQHGLERIWLNTAVRRYTGKTGRSTIRSTAASPLSESFSSITQLQHY